MDSDDLLALIHDDLPRYLAEVGDEEFNSGRSTISTNLKEVVTQSEVRKVDSVTALDGSSRSITYSYGIISLASVAATSNRRPVVGIYPPLLGSNSLVLNVPFVALASSSPTSSQGMERFLRPFTDRTPSGKPMNSLMDPDVVEGLLRAYLESQALRAVTDNLVLVDGPLLPSYVRLPDEERNTINGLRIKYLDKTKVGVVKRLERSTVLRSALVQVRDEVSRVMGLDPAKFASDQSLLLHWARFCLQPPYSTTLLGPVERVEYGVMIYSYYVLRPYHPFVPRFALLRVESLVPSREAAETVASMPLSGDGVPAVLAMADRVAKTVSLPPGYDMWSQP